MESDRCKEFKTLDEQIEILRSRGLNIGDVEKAKNFLLHNNYYRISGYSLTLRNKDMFYKDATFQNIIDIYCFDQELRHILLNSLEKIEVSVKSIYAYVFTEKYGPIGHLESKNFTNLDEHKFIFEKAEEQKSKNLRYEAYLKHFVEELKQPIPFWAYIDLLTISDISKLYAITDLELKKIICNKFSLNTDKGFELLEHFLHCMTIVRNLCAHGSRLYNRLFITKPRLSKNDKKLLRENERLVENDRLFGHLLIMKRLLSKEQVEELFKNIIYLCDKYSFVSMKYYGFPDFWETNQNIISKNE